MVFIFLENALNLGTFTHAPNAYSELQKKIFKNLFLQTADRSEENYYLFY